MASYLLGGDWGVQVLGGVSKKGGPHHMGWRARAALATVGCSAARWRLAAEAAGRKRGRGKAWGGVHFRQSAGGSSAEAYVG